MSVLIPSPAACPWADHLARLDFNFHICKMGLIKVHFLGCWKVNYKNKALRMCLCPIVILTRIALWLFLAEQGRRGAVGAQAGAPSVSCVTRCESPFLCWPVGPVHVVEAWLCAQLLLSTRVGGRHQQNVDLLRSVQGGSFPLEDTLRQARTATP